MSFDIQLYRTETKQRQKASGNDQFFDNEENLVPFTDEQFQSLKERLLEYDYVLESDKPGEVQLSHDEYNIKALLTRRGLYFTAGWDQGSMFEAGMTASELTDSGEFEKYDPQNGGWEEIEG
ncbi:hypothetical protein SAMN05660909_01247 [Chitinophaga terrae (ex Kim and Jung 2007)]|uniref:Uncharacterized protein n=1 Tax=Chitinophaga terrae (ex Kim and Jung 2007) TaxID=408074 RepID=A0A1H3ZJ32_9BACT|nr:hypothetical protein [Chitinophaga terrae (ex Kim and Jung 2007)]MDQ0107372.1 hypothetical protein [Chitinophaga terrae (ex Kim and Jung 2007)]GEP88776.1 hypothetical protein CTE07_04210 [Chitinophaga terrae (ex Kim and Jung 2007)]SEA23608.1 hypothetical protein SAMN05660909_01247 [Chitinophaga terrae (ex Kim and Jung 2007)]